MTLRLVMMGTGTFALPMLRALCASSHQMAGLFTQPNRKGRGHHRHRHPIKEAAREQNVPVFQPQNVNRAQALADLRILSPDLCVVAAYGQMLSPKLLEIPRLGAINVHASLLPKYRGASPVQYAIWQGETETGVTIFQIEPALDTGPILGIEKTPIKPGETAGELERRLAELAVPLCLRVIDGLAAGTIQPVPQNAQQATRAPRLKKSDGEIDWNRSAGQISRHVRAMQPWPQAFTFLSQSRRQPARLILLEVEPAPDGPADFPAGSVIVAEDGRLLVQTGNGALEILRLQPEGKRAMTAGEFLRGHSVQVGQRLGSHNHGD